jgi:COP9 signalosome complex subunit 7
VRSAAHLLPALDLTSVRQLEDLIIEALYSDLLKARINQKRQILEVDSVVGRDIKTGAFSTVPFGQEKTVANLLQTLSVWYDRVGSTLGELDYHIQGIKQKE